MLCTLPLPQVADALAAPYQVTINPLFQQISHGYQPAAVPAAAPHHPTNPLGQGNQVSFTVKADRHGMASGTTAPCMTSTAFFFKAASCYYDTPLMQSSKHELRHAACLFGALNTVSCHNSNWARRQPSLAAPHPSCCCCRSCW